MAKNSLLVASVNTYRLHRGKWLGVNYLRILKQLINRLYNFKYLFFKLEPFLCQQAGYTRTVAPTPTPEPSEEGSNILNILIGLLFLLLLILIILIVVFFVCRWVVLSLIDRCSDFCWLISTRKLSFLSKSGVLFD